MRVFAPSGGVLRRWDWNIERAAWTALGVAERWEDGSGISTSLGIGITKGFASDRPEESLFAAIASTVPGATPQTIEFARYETRDVTLRIGLTDVRRPVGHWRKFGSDVWSRLTDNDGDGLFEAVNGQRSVAFSGRPTLAYLPFDAGVPREGRFFLAYTQAEFNPFEPEPTQANLKAHPYLRLTQGNRFPLTGDAATGTRGLTFLNPTLFRNVWSNYPAGFSSVVHEGNVRAVAFVQDIPQSAGLTFFPNVDGAFNGVQRDHDDFRKIQNNLAGSLRRTCD